MADTTSLFSLLLVAFIMHLGLNVMFRGSFEKALASTTRMWLQPVGWILIQLGGAIVGLGKNVQGKKKKKGS